jgi:hypothetical protein
MHTKNFSLILNPEDRSYSLAPLYDCLCTSLYGFHDVLALPLNGTNRPKIETAVKFMEAYLSLEEMRDMALGVNRNLEPVLKLAFSADAAKEQTAQKRLQGAITERNLSVLKVIETELEHACETSSKRVWNAIEDLHAKHFLTDNSLALSGETLTPLKYGEYRKIDAAYLVTNDRGGYNQAKQLAKELAIQGTVKEENAQEFSFQVRAEGTPVSVHVTSAERLRLTTENYKGIPALDEKSVLAQNILSLKERGSDLEKNARNTVDLIALAGIVDPAEQKKAIEAANEVSTGKIREIRDLVKRIDLDKALATVQDIPATAKESIKEKYEKIQTRRGVDITD